MDVRAYFNTGFNSINIPDSPTLLNAGEFSYTDFPSLDVMQNRFLSNVRVRATWEQIKNADYIRLLDGSDAFYYTVDNIAMTSYDVANISIIPDFITSAGGFSSLKFLDGIVTRCHVSDDSYGAWSLDDEFLTPSEPLLMDTHTIDFSRDTVGVAESSVDLGLTACVAVAIQYEDADGETVTIPKSFENMASTVYELDGRTAQNRKTTVTILDDNIVRAGIEQCRALGIESATANVVEMPTSLVEITTTTESVEAQETIPASIVVKVGGETVTNIIGGKAIQSGSWRVVSRLSGVFKTTSTGLLFEYDTTVKNKRVLYGNINRVGILTTAGNRLESNPEDIRGGNRSVIHIKSVGDPHTNGAPYHRFEYMNGNNDNAGFWLNAIKGLPWKQIPILYSEKSGSALDRVAFDNAREIANYQYGGTFSGMMYKAMGGDIASMGTAGDNTITPLAAGLSGVASGAAAGAAGGSFGGLIGAAAGGILGGVAGGLAGIAGYTRTSELFKMQKRQEMQQFSIQQNVVAPQISVEYDGEAYRDFYGESVICYRYRPTPTDIARLDKILTMYGYRVNIPIETTDIFNREYFNYISGQLTVGGDIPKWLADGVSLQISNGVRIWHVKPNNVYYTNNPIKE